MNANELRVGNVIANEFGNICRVCKILDYDRVCLGTGKSTQDLRTCQPIPLTEDTLLKLGFELIDSGQPREHEDYHEWPEKDYPEFGCVYKGDGDYVLWEHYEDVKIHYLHQLQNLYFAITGRELAIRL